MEKLKLDEKGIVSRYENKESMKSISLSYGVSVRTVRRVLTDNGITIRTKGGIEPLNEEEIISMYKRGISSSEIAKKFNVTIHSITNILEKNSIPRNNIYHNKSLVEDYWSTIDSFDKAYFLGFLMTDGNVFGNTYVRLQLSSKDEEILKTFSKYTKNTNKISPDKRNLSSFNVKRKRWVDDLRKYGVIPNKTGSLKFFELDNKELMSHLIRGLIDGDGWISEKSHQIGFCGNENVVTGLRDYLVKNLGVFNVSVIHLEENLWQITWASKKDIRKIGDFIYKDKGDCYLSRKYENYEKIIQADTEVSSEIAKGSETL